MYANPFPRTESSMTNVSMAHQRAAILANMLSAMDGCEDRLGFVRRASGDPLENLKRIAVEYGASDDWMPLVDQPQNGFEPLMRWFCDSAGCTIVHAQIGIGESAMFVGFVYDRNDRLVARFENGMTTGIQPRSLDEIQRLKDAWLIDSDIAFEDADGFGAHVDELRHYRVATEGSRAAEEQGRREGELANKMAELSTDNRDLAAYALKLEQRIQELEERLIARDAL